MVTARWLRSTMPVDRNVDSIDEEEDNIIPRYEITIHGSYLKVYNSIGTITIATLQHEITVEISSV